MNTLTKKQFTNLKYSPKYVAVTLDLRSEQQFLELTYEWKGKLSQFSEFLTDVRMDLAKNGLSVTDIRFGGTGLSFPTIMPEIDPDGMAFPKFSVKPTDQFRREYEDFLAAAQELRRRAQEANDE